MEKSKLITSDGAGIIVIYSRSGCLQKNPLLVFQFNTIFYGFSGRRSPCRNGYTPSCSNYSEMASSNECFLMKDGGKNLYTHELCYQPCSWTTFGLIAN